MKSIISFFDKLEDVVRGRLSRHPIVYTIIGGVAIVLFWRGVWLVADYVSLWFTGDSESLSSGVWSIIISIAVLLVTGLFVSFFIGDVIIMSGIRKEKKLAEKTEQEVETESDVLRQVKKEVAEIKKTVQEIKNIEEKQK